MSRRLDDLHPAMRGKAVELIARCIEAGIMIAIVDTLRTADEHQENLKKGTSWTLNSRHLVGKAIDVAPWFEWRLYGADKLNWDASDPVWQKIGDIGEKLGLRWGGRWKQKDMGHFEIVE